MLTMDSFETSPSSPKQSSSLAIIVVILIIALGGAYFWYQKVTKEPKTKNLPPNATQITEEELERELEASGDIDLSAEMQGFEEVYK